MKIKCGLLNQQSRECLQGYYKKALETDYMFVDSVFFSSANFKLKEL